MELNDRAMKALLDAFDRSDWREMTVAVGADRLHVSRDPSANGSVPLLEALPPAAPVAAPTPALETEAPAQPAATAAAAPAAPTTSGTVIESPSVGLFWRAPAPGAPPFVEVGGHVKAGETVAIVEVMKLMNHVASPVDGLVTEILVENGDAVEFGQAIVVVDPEG
jgi:acetyl-CoA carboxylase biotin carboxyl carrier protein